MTNRQHFQRGGRGVFRCDICGRSCRMVDQGNDRICQQCWDIAGLDNTVNDEGREPTARERAHGQSLLTEISAKGGDADAVREANEFLFPKGA